VRATQPGFSFASICLANSRDVDLCDESARIVRSTFALFCCILENLLQAKRLAKRSEESA